MPRILALSSQVARGHVGLSAMVPALNSLGHEVIALPTVLLSNHPGHPTSAGQRIDADVLGKMTDALAANGWLDDLAAVVTGYLPAPEHVAFAAELVQRVRERRRVIYLCDPVLGDDGPGLYIDPLAAAMIRDRLAPLADIVTPNRFEAGWLAAARPRGFEEVVDCVHAFAGQRLVAVTSADVSSRGVLNLLHHGATQMRATVPWQARVPHGTGDLFAALLLGHLLDGESDAAAFARSVAGVDQVVRASAGADELNLVATLGTAAGAGSWALETL
jgi:pyridoxine kinase